MVTSLVFLQLINVKKFEKLAKIAKIKENLHIFWKTRWILLKFSGKINLVIISKVTENKSFTLSLEKIISEKRQGGQIDSSVFLGLRIIIQLNWKWTQSLLFPDLNKMKRYKSNKSGGKIFTYAFPCMTVIVLACCSKLDKN